MCGSVNWRFSQWFIRRDKLYFPMKKNDKLPRQIFFGDHGNTVFCTRENFPWKGFLFRALRRSKFSGWVSQNELSLLYKLMRSFLNKFSVVTTTPSFTCEQVSLKNLFVPYWLLKDTQKRSLLRKHLPDLFVRRRNKTCDLQTCCLHTRTSLTTFDSRFCQFFNK